MAMKQFNFPYHTQSTEYPESGTRVQLGNSYVFTAPPSGPDMRRFRLSFPTMKYFISDELSATNRLINNVFDGAVVGAPGTVPTNMIIRVPTGISYQIAGKGFTENQEPYIDIRYSGTNTSGATQYPGVYFTNESTAPTASQGQIFAASVGVAIVGGSLTNFQTPSVLIGEYTNTGTLITNGTAAFTPTSVLKRYSYTRTLTSATVVELGQQL